MQTTQCKTLCERETNATSAAAALNTTAQATTPGRVDAFGCFPTTCAVVPDPFGRQLCEDWKAGRPVSWPPDCGYVQSSACRKLCENQTAGQPAATMPTTMPTDLSKFGMGATGSISPSDFIFHPRDPACVDDADYHTTIIYARPSDRPDRYDEMASKLRSWFRSANGLLNTEAKRFDMNVDIKTTCTGTVPVVVNVVLPKASSSYNAHDGKTTAALGKELPQLGYGATTTKYIVYYDGVSDGCEGGTKECIGQATIKGPDDRLVADNIFNKGPDFAVLYDGGFKGIPDRYHIEIDMMAPIILLHEFSHTLGAVQPSAPHSSKDDATAGHCNDEPPTEEKGNDIMCKSDKSGVVFGDACKDSFLVFHYDCNNDDYFNPKPAPGTYLATHWNLGSTLNRFFKFGTV